MEFNYRRDLREELVARKSRNEAYSLRAFARDLGISLTALHEVIHERRHLSRKNLQKVRESLSWSEDQFERASHAIRRRTQARAQIKEWHHHAILNLTQYPCPADPQWICERLGLEKQLVLKALDRLLGMQLVFVEDGQLVKAS